MLRLSPSLRKYSKKIFKYSSKIFFSYISEYIKLSLLVAVSEVLKMLI